MKKLSNSPSFAQIVSESKQDLTISWRLLRENWKAFVGTEIFAFGSVILIIIGLNIATLVMQYIFPFFPWQEFNNSELNSILDFIITIIILIILSAFLSCQYGLAYDIFSSGDTFAEFKSSFSYFRKYWIQYSVLAFLIDLGQSLFETNLIIDPLLEVSVNVRIQIEILFIGISFLFNFVWFVLFALTFPSLTEQGSLKRSLVENFHIVRNYPGRLFTTWGLFYICFIIPLYTLIFLGILLYDFLLVSAMNHLLIWFIISIILVIILLGAPLEALIATRIYTATIDLDQK